MPVPKAGMATERAWQRSATSSAARVAFATVLASVLRSGPMTAAWMIHCTEGWSAVVVATASPTLTGPSASASRSTPSPKTRLTAPATPASMRSSVFAGFTMASTGSSVMSPGTISR